VNQLRPLLGQTLTSSVIYGDVGTAIHSAVVLLADTARQRLENPQRDVILRRAFSLLLGQSRAFRDPVQIISVMLFFQT
jgi:hypothetical protein